jgi:hypothetical protein
MSLASKCREAISHVAILKRELELHQERAAEALSLQRQQTQRMASQLSGKINGEHVLSSMPPPHPPRSKPNQASPIQPQTVEPTSTASTSPESNTSSSSMASASSRADSFSEIDTVEQSQEGSINVSPSTLSSSSATRDDSSYKPTPSPIVYHSTPKKRNTPKQVSPNDDIHSPTMNLFPFSASPKTTISFRPHPRSKYDDEFPSDIVDPTTTTASPQRIHQTPQQDDDDQETTSSASSTTIQQRDFVGTSSVDAFEASFDTTFPAVFSSPTDQDSDPVLLNEESAYSYDPFALFAASPDRSLVRQTPLQQEDNDLEATSEAISEATSPENHGTPQIPVPTSAPWHADLALHNTQSYSTPPKDSNATSLISEERPKRPEKTPSAEARAKYENALQPRTSASAASSTILAPQDKTSGTLSQPVSLPSNETAPPSPSPLLKRIHQRRMNKQLSREQSMPSTSVPKPGFHRHSSAPEASKEGQSDPLVSADSRLNSQAPRPSGGSITPEAITESARLQSLRRRNVKQPVSYTEPALNTKLRQGHVYFQKEQQPVIPERQQQEQIM